VGPATDDVADARETGDNLKRYIDTITMWIPGDVLVIYATGVTVLYARGSQSSVV
jgi:hypothetical protein